MAMEETALVEVGRWRWPPVTKNMITNSETNKNQMKIQMHMYNKVEI